MSSSRANSTVHGVGVSLMRSLVGCCRCYQKAMILMVEEMENAASCGSKVHRASSTSRNSGEGRIGGHGSAHNVSANQCSIVLKVALRCQTPRNA